MFGSRCRLSTCYLLKDGASKTRELKQNTYYTKKNPTGGQFTIHKVIKFANSLSVSVADKITALL